MQDRRGVLENAEARGQGAVADGGGKVDVGAGAALAIDAKVVEGQIGIMRRAKALEPIIVEGGSKRRRRESVGAVENGGAHVCISEKWEDGGFSPYCAQLRREAQECDPTWSFGKRFVGRC
jgi:hypothetical protein